MLVAIWLAVLVILTIIHVYRHPGSCSLKGIVEAFLLYVTVVNIGFYSLWNFLANIFYSEEVAKFMGWGSGSPFQYEVGIAYLAFAVLGILCIWERGDFWLATIIGFSVFLFGIGIGHIEEYVRHHNKASGNAGLVLYVDLIMPIVLLILMMVHRRLQNGSKN
ncbi:MAG: hypothetical protein P4L16_02310 [Chlamydiales bacterium]|nr:hypothetical protein [Chlamydiales bacterium]